MRFSSKPAIFSTTGSWGFYYYGYRFYDPVNQRWLNRDPLGEGGGLNVFGFVGNGPIHRVDPLGLYWFEWGDSWPNYLGPEPNAKPRVGPPPPPPADPEEDLNLMRCSYGGMQIGEDAAHEAAGLVSDVGREALVGTVTVAVGSLIATTRLASLPKNCAPTVKTTTGAADDAVKWVWGQNKGVAKSMRQMNRRGWTPSQVTEAIKNGQQFPAQNLVNEGNPAIRYVHPTTGQSVVQDMVTKEIIHFGAPGYVY